MKSIPFFGICNARLAVQLQKSLIQVYYPKIQKLLEFRGLHQMYLKSTLCTLYECICELPNVRSS